MATSTARPRPSSILLQTYAYLPLNSNSLASPACSVSSHTSHTAKHIRFAPLPEPDRDNLHNTANPSTELCDPDPPQLVEHILASSNSSSSSSQLSSPTTLNSLCDTSPNSSVGSSPIIQPSTLPSKYPSMNPAVIAPNFIDIATTNANNPDSSSSSEQSLRWAKKPHIFLLRPFKRSSASSSASSSHTLTPTPSIENRKKRAISTEEILTLGAVNLFRPPSRESTRSVRTNDSSTWGLGLSRWPSLGGSNSNIPIGSPLTRTQSTQSYKSKSSSLLPTFPSSSSSSLSSDSKMKAKANPTPLVPQSAANRRKGTRMLNGRVYGGPKKNTKANPFANARDEEPEFVEWGYGGMGSVKGARSAGVSSNWERLQGGSAMGGSAKTRIDVGVGGVGAGIGAGDADLDDGSGLAWVKRRKEEREKKAREQKEKEEKEAEKENSESQTNTPIPTRSSTLESIATLSSPTSDTEPATHTPPTIDVPPLTIVLEEDAETVTKANFPTPIPSRYPSELGVSSSSYSPNPLTEEPTNADQSKPEEGQLQNNGVTHENERILQAITVPVRSPRHHHHRQPSKAASREVLISPVAEGPPALQIVGSPTHVSPSPNAGGVDTMDASTSLLHTSTISSINTDKAISPTSSSSSYEESESESEGADDGDGDDEDEDEDEEESQKQSERMKTTLGTAAGVEKISRHKE